MLHIDRIFADRVGQFVRNYKRKTQDLWNFSCCYCGDSKKDSRKARGFIYRVQNKLFYKCHNCSMGTTIGSLLKHLSPPLHQEYLTELLKSDHQELEVKEVKTITPQIKYTSVLDQLQSIQNTPAEEFVSKRKIPKEHWDILYYCEDFGKFVSQFPKYKNLENNNKPKLIIPFFDLSHNLFAFQARALENNDMRYITIMLEDKKKVYGLERVNPKEEVIIVEGPLDSLFLKNSIAMAGSDLGAEINKNIIIALDNEPRNKEIVQRLQKLIDQGFRVVVWPAIDHKDINDMVLAGYNAGQIIADNTFSGLEAKIKFNQWKKI